jgi:hypothetical protein
MEGSWCILAVRRRSIPFTWGRGRVVQEFSNPTEFAGLTWTPSDGSIAPSLYGSQITDSESHPYWYKNGLVELNNIGSRVFSYQQDVGGAFTMRKSYVAEPEMMAPPVELKQDWVPTTFNPSRNTRFIYQGPLGFGIAPRFYAFPPSAESSESALSALGTTAIARCSPTNSVADLASSLIELRREGLPKLLGSVFWKKRTLDIRASAKEAGGEYLNLEFGWKPLVSDVKDAAQALAEFDQRMKQYELDAGNVVRRRYQFPPLESKKVEVLQSGISPNMSPDVPGWWDPATQGRGSCVRTRVTTVRQWFSGAFTYHLPSDYQSREGVARLADQGRHILGLDLTPEVLWNVAPWSWAADWFSNTGDVIHNLTDWSSDGLVLKYGYIMEHSVVRDTLTFVGETGFKAIHRSPRPPELVLVTEVKLRRRATPFGFGLNLSSLTGRQKSILAALGMSRQR